MCRILFVHFNPCHEGKQVAPSRSQVGSPPVEQHFCSARAQSTKGLELTEESFVNLNLWDVSTWMPGFIQTCYLPSDGTIWEINLLKYEIPPESLFRLQRDIWKKDILPNFNYFTDVWMGRKKQNCFLVPNLNLPPCSQSISRAYNLDSRFSQASGLA